MDDRNRVDPEANQQADDTEYPPLEDEALAQIADETWLEYDIRESEQVEWAEEDDRLLNEMRDHE